MIIQPVTGLANMAASSNADKKGAGAFVKSTDRRSSVYRLRQGMIGERTQLEE